MLFHRYKAKFSSKVDWTPYKYGILRFWMFCSVALFAEVGDRYDLFWSAIIFWFLELLMVYLATDNKIFRVVVPWMLFFSALILAGLHAMEYTFGKNFISMTSRSISNDRLLGLSIWHMITCVIAILSINFNKYLNWIRRSKNSASQIK